MVRLYTTDGGVKLIRRGDIVERQYRQNLGKLPIGYRCEPDGRFFYIFKNAVRLGLTCEHGLVVASPELLEETLD